MPAPAVILAALSLITGLIGTMSGTGVTIHSAVQSEKAVELGQEALQREEENLKVAKQALDTSAEALQKIKKFQNKGFVTLKSHKTIEAEQKWEQERERRAPRSIAAIPPTQFDIADMEGKQVQQSSSVAGSDDEDYALHVQEEAPCVPIPTFVTGLCGHVAKDPTVSVIVLVVILASLCVEVMVAVFCAIWLRRRCHATCSKLIRRGTAGTVVTPHC